MSQQDFKYFAFISYSSKDTEWGKRVQKKLENYRMPATLCNERGWKRTPIKPVFFAPTDIQPGELTEELQERLRTSRNLIVVCSPNSAKSDWVGKEIEFFHQLGSTKQIHFFIIDGTPHSGDPKTECFNSVIIKLGLPEILGANIHEKVYRWSWMNKERAYVQLISKLLGIEFDSIWKRHKRLLIQKAIGWIVGTFLISVALLGVWFYNQTVDITVSLNEATVHNPALPPLKDAVLTITLDNEIKRDTIRYLQSSVKLVNIPRSNLGQSVRVTLECGGFTILNKKMPEYLPVDTTMELKQQMCVNLFRNPDYYGMVRFMLWNPNDLVPVSNTDIIVDGHSVRSDANGIVSLKIPIAEQKTAYPIRAKTPLASTKKSMPCGDDDIIETK